MSAMTQPDALTTEHGCLIETAITDSIGRVTYQHSEIYRTRAEAEQHVVTRPLRIWERQAVNTVIQCRTCWPANAKADAAAWAELVEDVARPAHYTLGALV